MTDFTLTPQEQKARNAIFQRIRSGKPQAVPAPEVPVYDIPGDPIENFKTKLQSFDGRYLEFASRAEAIRYLGETIKSSPVITATGEVSTLPKIVYSAIRDYKGTVGPGDFTDPHKAHVVQIAVADGVLGVGETGSVFVNTTSLGSAAAVLFSTNLYLLLSKSSLLPSIQQALAYLHSPSDPGHNYRGLLSSQQYGSFYTGPSATADIEAVHVTGAQAELTLTVLLY